MSELDERIIDAACRVAPLFGAAPTQLPGIEFRGMHQCYDACRQVLLLPEEPKIPTPYALGHALAHWYYTCTNPGLSRELRRLLSSIEVHEDIQGAFDIAGHYLLLEQMIEHYGGIVSNGRIPEDANAAALEEEALRTLQAADAFKMIGETVAAKQLAADARVYTEQAIAMYAAELLYETHPPRTFSRIIRMPVDLALAEVERLTGVALYTASGKVM